MSADLMMMVMMITIIIIMLLIDAAVPSLSCAAFLPLFQAGPHPIASALGWKDCSALSIRKRG